MGFSEAIKSGFSNYVGFSGRASRSEYWYWVLFVIVAEIVTSIIDYVIGYEVTTTLFGLAVILPGLCDRCPRKLLRGGISWAFRRQSHPAFPST